MKAIRQVGVIAEYDPFHAGHAWHLAETRRLTGAATLTVVMSSVFTQRGNAAILPPAVRARMALVHGADAVFSLPAVYAVRDADHFAASGVHLLAQLGCDAISFGAECAELSKLQTCAELLENESPAFRMNLRSGLDQGLPFPKAQSLAAESEIPGADALLSQPNNTLAICYLRAMIRMRIDMTPIVIPRSGDYRQSMLNGKNSSASSIRQALRRGDWPGIRSVMPPAAFRLVQEACRDCMVPDTRILNHLLLYRLRTMTDQEYRMLPDLSEGLENKLKKAAKLAGTAEELFRLICGSRYSPARIQRLCTHALLHMDRQNIEEDSLPPAALLLGLRSDSGITDQAKSGFPIIGKTAHQFQCQPAWFAAEERAYDIWALAASQPAGMLYRQEVQRI